MSLKSKMILIMEVLAGVTAAFFILLVYKKLDALIGNSNWALIIFGILLIIFCTLGVLSFKKIKKRITG